MRRCRGVHEADNAHISEERVRASPCGYARRVPVACRRSRLAPPGRQEAHGSATTRRLQRTRTRARCCEASTSASPHASGCVLILSRRARMSSRAIAARATAMCAAFHAKAGRPFTARQRQSRPDHLPGSSTRSMQPPSAPSRAAGSCPGPARQPPPAPRRHALCGRR